MTNEAPERIWVWQRERLVRTGNCVEVSLERNWAETMLPDVAEALGATIFSRADLAQAPAPVRVNGLARAHGIDKDAGWTLPIDTLCEIRDEMKPSGYGGAVCLEEVELIALATEARILAALEAPDAGVVAELVEAAKAQTSAMIAYWEADEAASYAEEHACTEDQVWLSDEQIKAMRKSATDAWQAIPALTEATAAALAKLGVR